MVFSAIEHILASSLVIFNGELTSFCGLPRTERYKKVHWLTAPFLYPHHLSVKWCERMWNKAITDSGQLQRQYECPKPLPPHIWFYGPWDSSERKRAYLVFLNFLTYPAKLTDEMIRKWQWSYNRFTLTVHFPMSFARISAATESILYMLVCYVLFFFFQEKLISPLIHETDGWMCEKRSFYWEFINGK